MPKVTFSASNKKSSDFDFPKLKLAKGERARLALIETEPVFEYVHRLQFPHMEDGVPIYITETRRDGTKYETNKLDFLSTPICLGDPDTIENDGSDPKNCPMCKLAADTSYTKPPARRFATHVIRYATKPGGFILTTPYSVQNIVWTFTDTIFNKIADFNEQWAEEGGLREHDITMGPCTEPNFQKAELAIDPKAEWRRNAETKQVTIETIKENRSKDLSAFCGTKFSEGRIKTDIERIEEAWNDVKRAEGKAPSTKSDLKLDAGLDDLLNSTEKTGSGEELSMDDLTGDEPETNENGWATRNEEYEAELAEIAGLQGQTAEEAGDLGEKPKAAPKKAAPKKVAPKPEPVEEEAAEEEVPEEESATEESSEEEEDEFADFLKALED